MTFIEDILKQTASLLLSLGVLGILGFIFKEYIKKIIDFHFKKQEIDLNLNASSHLQVQKEFIPMFRELGELVYKLKNYSREIVEKGSPVIQSKDLFCECCFLFIERLYKYRAFLDKKMFEDLHLYKRTSQDFLILLDVSDRPEELRETKAKFRPKTLMRLKELHSEMDELQREILKNINDSLNIKEV